MRFLSRRWANALTLAALFLAGSVFSASTRAGVIGSVNGVYGGGTATVDGMSSGPIDTLEPNNVVPGVPGGPSVNILDVSKTFNTLDPIDIVFTVINSGGITSYLFDEDVTNNTGFDWTDYHFVIGVGVGANFVPGVGGGLVQFDPSNPAGNTAFATGFQGAITVDWFPPGGHANGATELYDVQLLIFDTADPSGTYQFTLRQYPTIPEPSSVIILGVGIVGVLGYAARRRSRS